MSATDRELDAERRDLLSLFEQAPGFVAFLRGPKLVFELANAAYFQLVGHRDILGKSVREALPEVEGQGYFELIESAYATGEPFLGRGMRVRLQREPGAPLTEAYVDLIYQPIRGVDGAVRGILAQGQDVTEVKHQEAERQRVEEALRASEERYRSLFESIDDGFCLMQMMVDEHGETFDYRFLEANAAFEGQTGLVGAVGKTARELVPNLDPSWFRLYGHVAATGEPARFENHAEAMNRWFDVYANRVGRPALRQVALVFKDVTTRKRFELERERLLASEGAARRAAEAASQLKDDFLATVSHELRTPLNAMLGWVHLLRTGTLTPERRERALETIERNARAQAQLIEDLLDVSRILSGKLRLQVESVDVQLVVEGALETVRPAAEAKDIRLEPVLSSGAFVMGDPHRLQQVVWNLLSNAVKFTRRGGRVQVTVERRDSSVEVTVADTGQGIPKDFQPHVFERFRQQEGGTTRSYGGLGLGLSIVRQLVEMHGGAVRVFSEGEGQGATFTVSLPLSLAKHSDVSSPAELQKKLDREGLCCPPELTGLDVLVVDDELDAREMLRTMLESCGARVHLASSAAEGLRLLQAHQPAVLISDIGMPEEDGYKLIQKVRSLSANAGGKTPALALTAYARSEDRTRALMSGFNNHLTKPVEPLELLAMVASLAGRLQGLGADA
jgi:PAS domain S-box-containing protein